MITLEELTLYFYIACGVAVCSFILVFIILCVLCVKVRRCAKDDGVPGVAYWRDYPLFQQRLYAWQREGLGDTSNQLGRQTNMMADFCYTNPTIVPGEELYRRGFSMYSGADNFGEDVEVRNKEVRYGTYREARSKF